MGDFSRQSSRCKERRGLRAEPWGAAGAEGGAWGGRIRKGDRHTSSVVGDRQVSWKPEKKAFQGQRLSQLHQMLKIGQLSYRLRTDFEIGHLEVAGDLGMSSFAGVLGTKA